MFATKSKTAARTTAAYLQLFRERIAPTARRIFAGLLGVRPHRTPAMMGSLRLLAGGGLGFSGLDLLAGRLIDDLHGKPNLAAIVETKQLDIDVLAFF